MFTSFSSHRKNLWFTKGLWAALAMAALVFTGCPHSPDSDDLVPDALKGKWVSDSTPDEVYRITDTEFISLWADTEGYKGNIVNIISDGEAAGYIVIKYTIAYDPDNVGNFYVIHYKDLTASTVKIMGSSDGAGKAKQAEAEAEYTVAKGYFDDSLFPYSACTKAAGN
jgi:hypothetical protein